MARIEKHPELFIDTSDDELLVPSQVAAIFGIPTDALKSFMRTGAGPLPILVDLKVRYRFGDVRAFYRSEKFQEWLQQYEEDERARTTDWKKLFMETFSEQGIPTWFLNEMRIALRDVARDLLHIRLSEQMGNIWEEEFLKRELETLPQKVFEKAEMEAAKHLGRNFDNVLTDPRFQELIRERALEQMVAKISEHPMVNELACAVVDQERVIAAMTAASQGKQEKGWVYLIQGGNHSDIKIGKASNIYNRLSHHRSSNHRVHLVASFRGYTSLESRLHDVFRPYRIAREWFAFSLTIQEFLKQAFAADLALRPEVTGPCGENMESTKP